MPFIHLIALLAVFQFLVFGYLVGAQRRESGLKAPQMTGHEGFERSYRVQVNTLECLIGFLPVFLLAANYWPTILIAPLGVIYLVGRVLYRQAYVKDPASRGPGFILSMLPIAVLLALACFGAFLALFGISFA